MVKTKRQPNCKVCGRRFGGPPGGRVRRSDPKYHDPNKCAQCKTAQQREYQAQYRERIIAQQIVERQARDRAAVDDMKFRFRSLTCEWSGGQQRVDQDLVIRLDEGGDKYIAVLLPPPRIKQFAAWLDRTRQKSR